MFNIRIHFTLLVLGASLPALGQHPGGQPVKLAEFVVTPSRFGVTEERTTAAATLTSAELDVLPQLGDDLFRSIARLPGLAADDFTARFWVRGAPNSALLARLDGVDLIEPFHLKDVDGALSIVDPRLISRLDLLTGGFAAEFGNRLGGVLMMETKTPVSRRTALGLSLTGVGASYHGLAGGGRGRALFGARRGYPDVALRASGRDDEVEPRYYDLSGKFEYTVAPGHSVSVHVLHAGDTLRYQRRSSPGLSSAYDSDYVWVRWRANPSDTVAGEGVLSFARLAWNRHGSGRLDGFPFSLKDRRRLEVGSLRQELALTVHDRAVVRGGVEAKAADSLYDYSMRRQYSMVADGRQTVATDERAAALRPEGHAAGAFASLRVQPLRWLVVEPGGRFDRHTHTGDSEWNPRLSAAVHAGRGIVRAAWGMYSQAHGWHELAIADGETTFARGERAEHRVVGVEYPVARGTSLRIEAYQRIMTRPRGRWENVDNAYDLFPEVKSDRRWLAPERGQARGVEVLVSRHGPRLAWNASYALARAEEKLAGRWVPRARDQRHTFHGDVTYSVNPRWQFSASWQYHTGWPTTDLVHSLTTLSTGRRVVVSTSGPVYGLRLPEYHRLDLRATRRFALRRGELRAFVDVFNAYDRVNIVGYDHPVSVAGPQLTVTRKPREQLPVLPSFGVEWEF
jgi:outer membrane cobalamin receptor